MSGVWVKDVEKGEDVVSENVEKGVVLEKGDRVVYDWEGYTIRSAPCCIPHLLCKTTSL